MPTSTSRAFNGQTIIHVPGYSTVTSLKVNGVTAGYTINGNVSRLTLNTPCSQGDVIELIYDNYAPLVVTGGVVNAVSTPVVDYNFKTNLLYGPVLSVVNASGGYVDDSTGNWTLVPVNTLRRSDKGVLIEGDQTNSIRNNSMQGAVAGTPGTLPTNWSQSQNTGLAPQVMGTGTENGIDYIDIRIAGTTSGTDMNIFFEAGNNIAALTGQLWSASSFLKLQAGSLTGITGIKHATPEYNSAGSFVATAAGPNLTLTSASLGSQRSSFSRTLSGGATTAFVRSQIIVNTTSGAAVDVTLRIGWPQLEQWSTTITTVGGASSPIRTAGAAIRRAADIITANMSSALPGVPFTAAVVARAAAFPFAASIPLFRLGPTVSTGYRVIFVSPNAGMQAGETAQAPISMPVIPLGSRFALATAGDTIDQSGSVNGSTVSQGGSVLSQSHALLGIGGNGDGGQPFAGYIERLVILPARMVNAEVQRLATLATWP